MIRAGFLDVESRRDLTELTRGGSAAHRVARQATEYGIEYQTRSGLMALPHRLGMAHRKPQAFSRKLDSVKTANFVKAYRVQMNQLSADQAVIFAEAVRPTHAVRPVGCRAPKHGAGRAGTLSRAGCRIKPYSVPACCPHLNPIERP